jgi:hypothetical protein
MNPFHKDNEKIYDGRRQLSNAVQLRQNGTVTLPLAGPAAFVLHSGIINCLTYNNGVSPSTPNVDVLFNDWMENPTNIGVIQFVRIVSCGIRFNLVNGDEEDDGCWEAARTDLTERDLKPGVQHTSLNGLTGPNKINISNAATYQTGHLRDLDQYVFTLNSLQDEHPFIPVAQNPDGTLKYSTYDTRWDAVFVKIFGRQTPTIPSVVYYEVVCNVEVVYKDGTNMARYMQENVYEADWRDRLAKKYFYPGWLAENEMTF